MINLALATGNIGREGAGCTMITGQGNGQGGREHRQKCDQLARATLIDDPEARSHVGRVSGVSRRWKPHRSRLYRHRVMESSFTAARSKRCSPCASTRWFHLPDANFTREALEKLEFFGVIDFFLSETAQFADVVLPAVCRKKRRG